MTAVPDGGGGARRWLTPATVLWGLAALLGLVLMLQNTDQTRVHVLGFVIEMPLFLLIFLAMVLGWVLGAFGWWAVRRRRGSTG